ncbi:coniferyl-alcohol dehydrogenase [Marinibaculum pumilum]|uniref:Coniferyl-alcohol dehydrogenase n=1 Tax=Marinibaculum pumilum TaxID=1766165 RepID=A0ABV7L1W3_9PROT
MHNGRTYIVTGAASGIGAETCRQLRAAGARVIGVDRHDTDNADELFLSDLSDPAAIDDLATRLPEGADGLANIAGLPPTAAPDLLLKVNLIGLRRLTERLVPKLADGASIVNLASLAGFGWADALDQVRGALALDFDGDIAGFCADNRLAEGGRSYFLSKEALIVWTMQNRWTWRERGIRMNAISPGPVDTPILPDFIETLGARAEEDMRVMDRPGRPVDIAPVVGFLLSTGSGWLRGANIAADGGMSSHLLTGMHGL